MLECFCYSFKFSNVTIFKIPIEVLQVRIEHSIPDQYLFFSRHITLFVVLKNIDLTDFGVGVKGERYEVGVMFEDKEGWMVVL